MSIRRLSVACVAVVAFVCALTGLADGQCLPDNLDGLCCQPMTPSLPSFPTLSTGLKYICWDECDARLSRDVCLVLGAPRQVRIANQAIDGVYTIAFTARACGGNTVLWNGSLVAHYSRTWLESSVPGPSPDTGVWRFVLNGSVTPTSRIVQQYGNNSCAIPPCFSSFGTLYVQGYIDYARDCQTNQWTAAGSLYHGCDAEIHGPTSARPAPPAGFHTRSYSWVWPAAGFVPFSSTEAGRRSEGTVEAGAVRLNQWTTRPGITRYEEPVTAGQVQATGERCNCTGAGSLVPQYVVTQISGGAASCGSIFQTSGAGLLQKRIGRWTAPAFPGAEYLLLDFGNIDHANGCNGLATTEYFEGVETIGGFPAASHGGAPLAPQFEDLASSNRATFAAPVTLIGKNHISWYVLTLNVRAAFDVAWAVDADGFWDVPSNWSTGVVPGANDRVLIDRPAGNFTITVRQPGAVAERILSEERLTIVSGGELTVSGTVQVNNVFTLDGGKLAGAMVLPGTGGEGLAVTTSVGPAILSGVTMDAGVSIPSSAVLRVTNGLALNGTITNAAALEFFGAQTLSGTGQIVFPSGGGTKVVRPLGGTLTIAAGISIQGESGTVGQAGTAFVNQGTIRAASSSVTMSVVGSGWSSTGTIQATNGGSLDLSGTGWTNAGSLSITGGGSLDLSGTWTNTGAISMTASTVNLGGTFTNGGVGSLSRSGGTVNVTGTLNNTALTLNATTGSWRVAGGTIVGGTIATSGGAELIGAGGTLDAVTLNGSLSIPDGTSMSVTNGLTLNGSISLNSTGGGAALTFSGAQTLLGSGEIVFATSSSSNAVRPALGTLTIGPTMTIRGGAGTIGQPGVAFVNRGAIRAQSAAQTITLTGTAWSNEGTLAATSNGRFATSGSWSTSGTVSISSGSSLTATGSYVQTAGLTVVDGALSTTGAVTIQGGALRGAGTINGNVTSAGSISPGSSAGTLNVAGTYAQENGGALNIELGGTTTGTFDQLLASGAVTIDGTLNVSLIGGFQPAIGDQFIILTGASVSGTFATANGLDVGFGKRVQVNVNPTNVTLVVTRVFTIQWAVDADGFWDVASNWSPAHVPNANDNVLIDRPAGNFTVTVRQTGAVANDILSEENLKVIGFTGTLTVSGTVQVNNTFTLDGGTLANARVLAGSGGQGITTEAVLGVGYPTLDAVRLDCSLLIPLNMTVNVRNGLTLNGAITFTSISNSLSFIGSQTLAGSGDIVFAGPGSGFSDITLMSGTLTIEPGITVRGLPGSSGRIVGNINVPSASFVNLGTIRADQSGQLITLEANNWLNQASIVAASGASLTLFGDNWNNASSVTISGGGTLRVGGSAGQGSALARWTNTGTIAMTQSIVNLGGRFTVAALGNFSRDQGTVNLVGTIDNANSNLVLDATTGSWSAVGDPNPAVINGGTVTVTSPAQFTVALLTLDAVIVNGTMRVLPNTGPLMVLNGLTLNGSLVLGDSFDALHSHGSQTIRTDGVGEVVFDPGPRTRVVIETGTLTIESGITIRGTANSPGELVSALILGNIPSASFINRGAIRADQPNQTIKLEANNWLNQGTMVASNGGSLTLFGDSWTNASSVTISGGGVLRIGGSGAFGSAPAPWTNTGTITMSGSLVNLGGRFDLGRLGNFSRDAGTVQFVGTLDNANTNLVLDETTGSWVTVGDTAFPVINGGTVTVLPPAELIVHAAVLDGVTIDGDLDLVLGGQVEVSNGLTLGGTAPGLRGSFTVHKSLTFVGTQTLAGSGDLVFADVGHVEIPSATLTIGPDITVRCEPNTTGHINGGFVNEGTIELADGGRIDASGTWSSSGTISIASGCTLGILGTITQTSGELIIDGSLASTISLQGGLLRGTGSVGPIVNNAVIAPGASAGTLSIGGTFAQQSSGSFNVELGGTATSEFDRLLVSADANLGGALNVSLINGFQPVLGQTFTILTFASSTGAFATTSGLDLGGGLRLQVNVNPMDVTLEVVASP
ncbi:MAG: hypothetical protein HY292_21100 [Planctomycetes bacterium]|nr:hypothetical protein [Planctomycetota bacterium]